MSIFDFRIVECNGNHEDLIKKIEYLESQLQGKFCSQFNQIHTFYSFSGILIKNHFLPKKSSYQKSWIKNLLFQLKGSKL